MRFNTLYTIFFALMVPIAVKAQIKLEKKSFVDNKVELLVPADFKPMTAEMMNLKYPNRNPQPNAILTDEDGTVNVVISYVPQAIRADQIAEFKNYQISTLKKARPDAKWLEEGVKTINGKKVGYFKFIVNAVDQTVFNYYFFTDLNGKILLMTFNCTENKLPDWKDTVENIVSSLKVK